MKVNELMNELVERRDSSFKMGLEIGMRSKYSKRLFISFLLSSINWMVIGNS